MKQSTEWKAIRVGMPWDLTLTIVGADNAMFPAGATYSTKVRETSAGAVLTTATVTRIDDDNLEIQMTTTETTNLSSITFKENSCGLQEGSVLMDIMRTDTTPDEPADILMCVPVYVSPSA